MSAVVAAKLARAMEECSINFPLLDSALWVTLARGGRGLKGSAGYRIVATAGQRPLAKDGTVPTGAEAQAELCFSTCAEILAEAGMGAKDVVRINAFVTGREHMAGYMAARDAWLASTDHLPASTLAIVSGFTRPECFVEIEVTAAAK